MKTQIPFGTRALLLIALLIAAGMAQAQFEANYEPIQFSGEIPEHFRISAREKSLAEIDARDQAKLSEEQGKEYYTLSNFALSQVFLSGNIYFNDELTEYVNRVVDHLLEDEPALRAQLKVHVGRFSTPNATSWRDGTILVNIGLLTYLQNEAQLAYILAHEIAHFQSEHILLSFQKEQDLKEEAFSNNEDTDRLFAQLKFSREQELDADEKGLELYLKSAYDPLEAARALLMLEVSNEEEEGEAESFSLDLLHIFQADSSFLCKEENKRASEWSSEWQQEQKESSESLSLSEEEQEKLRTHPSIEARIKFLGFLLAKVKPSDKQKFIEPEAAFFRLRQLAYFELVGKYYQQSRYGRSLYLSLLMMERWPENQYLQILSSKNLYWIAYFRTKEDLGKVLDELADYRDSPYGDFLCFLYQQSEDQMRQASRDYVSRTQTVSGGQEDIDFYLARLIGLYEEEEAQPYYQQYLTDYPTGKYQYFVEKKISQQK